ncbi:hypothetical protein SAMN05421820_104332 [Pedobacter steynii]|uniref:Uncharacterized protein n=1 Tax=Pedobacter steynii TaxID=430522 RepID=A0A1G9UZ73_9SPHI|nr:hypothetical protein [Pedobacter steynii]NQX40927.1 hypothetical protein [Pedobacter steynii]SDM65173.1 hypothetical protein SAMN05421820_104332 [Pedobacter steynii]
MKRPNELMTLKGFDLKGTKRDLILEQPFSNTDDKHYGMPITPCAALDMIKRFQDQISNNDAFSNVYWVEFSKASIFRILSQETCEYVRFYLAIPEIDGKEASLTLEGANASGEVIGKEIMLQIAARMKAQRELSPNVELDEDSIYSEFKHELPPSEEKGNGGKGFLDTTNVKSMRGFIEEKSQELTQTDFPGFLKTFYKYIEDKF